MKFVWEHHKTKGWTNEKVDVRAYLPSFTSAFSVNNTFCPLISLWITWWAWRWANPCMKKRRGRRGCSELGSGLSSRVAVPSTPKPIALGPVLSHSGWVQWDPRETCSSTSPAQFLVTKQRHGPQVIHVLYLNTAQHLHCRVKKVQLPESLRATTL